MYDLYVNKILIIFKLDLRMCEFVDRVLQMQDGKLVRVYTGSKEVMELAKGRRN